MRFTRVADWLDYQQRLHPRRIDPGLERVRVVADRLGLLTPEATVLTVAGTNGKGSTVAFLEAIAKSGGYRPGGYTSPHILDYNERIRIGGQAVDDERLLAAFEAVERARGEQSLTFFEFGTLAALWCFRESGADPWLLEVGLGGRLDAVNVLAADVAVVTSIAIDHADWLGGDRDTIAREKAGVMRPGQPTISGESDPPAGLLTAAHEHGATLYRRGSDFDGKHADQGWDWRGRHQRVTGLPLPLWAGSDGTNAAAALAAWEAAGPTLRFPSREAVATALASAQLRGRLEWLDSEWLLDVAHNPAAAERLATALAERTEPGPVRAVIAAMARKDVAGIVTTLSAVVDVWHPLQLDDEDAWDAATVTEAVEHAGGCVAESGGPDDLLPLLGARDGIKLVCGSFRAVEVTMRWYRASDANATAVGEGR